jgi:peroxiredoxin
MTDFPLPTDLPAPENDGACDHLTGMMLPSISLSATSGKNIDLSTLTGRTVVYIYPMTGQPGVALPDGWNDIPGARGCTPQSCAFRDHYADLQKHDTRVFGLSVQNTAYQREAAERLHLPYPILSDAQFEFATALSLPTFEVAGMTLIKRISLIVRDGVIEHVFYPVFPPDQNATDVLNWLAAHPA